jgi:hypothetical protein
MGLQENVPGRMRLSTLRKRDYAKPACLRNCRQYFTLIRIIKQHSMKTYRVVDVYLHHYLPLD